VASSRHHKTCPRDVLELVERKLGDEDEETAKVTRIADPLSAIGCTACRYFDAR
jgi:hypothetical protein